MDRRELEAPGPPDVRDEAWYQVVAEILELRSDGAHAWAEARLARMQQQIEATHRVEPWQRGAIAGIRGSEWAPGRAYDAYGFGRRWR